MAPTKKHYPSTYKHNLPFLLLLSAVTTSAAVSTFRCSTPSPTPEHLPDGDDTLQLLRSFQISTGYFSGGDRLFASDDDPFFSPRSFSLFPHKVARTTNRTFLEVTATLTLSGPRSYPSVARQQRHRFVGSHSASFYLHGYYHLPSDELCMLGVSGSSSGDDGSIQHLRDVNLRLRVPKAPNISDPFVTGLLDGTDFETISLVAYDEGDHYMYSGKKPFCPPPTSEHAARGALQALEANFSCPHLRQLLISSYRLEYGDGEAYASNPFAPRQHELRMHVNQMHCTANGSVRAYMVFSNDTDQWWWYRKHLLVNEEAVVADGYWDSTANRLCLRACRVVSGPSNTDLAVGGECGIGISFWFPAVWTIRDRSVAVGLLWNASQGSGGNKHVGVSTNVISASSIDKYRSTNLSDVKYNYTMVEKAKTQYLKTVLRSKSKKGRFPGNNTFSFSYQDFKFHFFLEMGTGDGHGHGQASPVTIGSVMVDGDKLAADDMFLQHAMGERNKSWHAVVEMDNSQLLNLSYDINYHVQPANWQRPKNGSYSVPFEHRQISAEGVYDPKTGYLCMIGCRELNGSTDCEILVTVQFASLDPTAQGHGWGKISSQREKTDPLYFETMDLGLYGMYTEQIDESIWRMKLESIMVVISTMLSSVFTVMQIRHTERNPEAPPATSFTMLVLLALGYITPLVLNVEALLISRRAHYVPLSSNGWLELNEVALRVPTLIVFVLQLHLLQLVSLGRRTDDGSKAKASWADEKKALRICIPLYLLGGIVAGIVHLINGRAASMENSPVVLIAANPATLWEDLMSYAGIILDGFLLPQVIQNAFSGSRVKAISPWFYVGGTMIRAMPHVYDVFRAHNYVPSLRPSYIYANPRDDLFSIAWDIVIPLGAALLALLLFLQQRLGGAFLLCSRSRRHGEYEMVSTVSSPHEVKKAFDHRQEDVVTD